MLRVIISCAIIVLLLSCTSIVSQEQACIIERLGKYQDTWQTGHQQGQRHDAD